ncbi:MAG: V-type ATP synthase subunit I [Alistipes sp.]|nr:V-type ATP synthase subunit I [Alistipes sp.]
MIVRMQKYDFVLFAGQKEDFLEKLQDLGLVDITVRGWEPDEKERELMLSIERHRAAVSRLRAMANDEAVKSAVPYSTGREAYENYSRASAEEDNLTALIAQERKEAEYLGHWGEFDPGEFSQLEQQGVKLRYFHAYTKEFESRRREWEAEYTVYPVSQENGITYFVVITAPGQEVLINAQEDRAPEMTYTQKLREIEQLEARREALKETIERAAASVDLIEQHGFEEEEELHIEQVLDTGVEAADGTLILMEGWATAETARKVDDMLTAYPNLFYVKSEPTPDDEPPVLLRNNRFNKMFEVIGSFYSLPKYGTLDLTPFFGPFYVLFFGLCLADAGYGLIFLVAGLIMRNKVKADWKPAANLVTLCGLSTVICGMFLGSFFGIQLTDIEAFGNFRNYILSPDNMFALALGLGVVQILFGMFIKVANLTRQFGFRYALATLGWILVLLSAIGAYILGQEGVPAQFAMSAVPVWIWCVMGLGGFMMFFLNSPGKNPFMNFGTGLWNTYNHLTGIIGDVLSYIRLFAIGLSGGILASVFNQLALGLSPDIPVVRQICIILILSIGHGITLFMSTLSAFVHPMRLTFVEFYGNAGFEASQRKFNPLKRSAADAG